MSIIKNSAIQRATDNSFWFLPPYSLVFDPVMESTIIANRNEISGKIKQILNRQDGWTVNLSGTYYCATDADGLAFMQAFRDFLRPTSSITNRFDICDWSGDGVARFFNGCVLTTDVHFTYTRPKYGQWSIAFTSDVPALSDTSSTGSIPGDGPYAVILPSAGVAGGGVTTGGFGQTGGTGYGSGNGGVIVVSRMYGTFSSGFSGVIDRPTDSLNIASRQIVYTPDADLTVTSAQVVGGGSLSGLTSGQTTINIADKDYQTETENMISVTAPATSNTSDVANGAVTILAGQPLYIYISDASGHHSDLQLVLGIDRET